MKRLNLPAFLSAVLIVVTNLTYGQISVSAPSFIRSHPTFHGAWMQDPLQTTGAGKIWVIPSPQGNTVFEYASMGDLLANIVTRTYVLPQQFAGTGHVVYGGNLYYNKLGSNNLVKYNLTSQTILLDVPLPGAGFMNTYHYNWGGFSDIDFAADENGLWVMYATAANAGRLVVSRLDPTTLAVAATSNTNSEPKTQMGNAFIARGVVYCIDDYSAVNQTINYTFDLSTGVGSSVSIPWVNGSNYMSSCNYNATTGLLYSWNNSGLYTHTVTNLGVVSLLRNNYLINQYDTVAFPTAATGNATLSFALKNSSSGVLNLNATTPVQITGDDASHFSVSAPSSLVLSPGQTATFNVTYTPTSSGVKNVQLNVNSTVSTIYSINLKGAGFDFYGPQYPPIGTIQTDFNGEAGRVGGRNILINAVSLSTKTDTYWGPQINSSGDLQLKVSLDGSTYIGKEILKFDPTTSNLPNGVAVWRGETRIQNAINGSSPTVYIRATLTTKRPNNSVVPMVNPRTLGLSEEVGGLVKFNGLADFLVANYFIEASLSPNSGFSPYLNFYDAYPTPPGPLPGQGIGLAYSSITNGFYWKNISPRLTTNNTLVLNEGATGTITTSLLNATDDESMPAFPQKMVFEFASDSLVNPFNFSSGVLKKGNSILTTDSTFTLKNVQDGLISFSHNGGEVYYDDFQFSLRDNKGALAVDGPHTVYTFRVQINPVNDPPVANDLAFQGSKAVPLIGTFSASDPENDTLTFELLSQPLHGSVSLINDSSFQYTPQGGFTGDVSFLYSAFDGQLHSDSATVTIHLVNSPPVAIAQNVVTQEGTPITGSLQGTDTESDSLAFSLNTSTVHGITQLTGNQFTYTPIDDFFGVDSFTFSVSDSDSSSIATVVISVTPAIDAGDLLIADRNRIVIVDPTHHLDTILYNLGFNEASQVIHKPGGPLYILDRTLGLIKAETNELDQLPAQLVNGSAFNSSPGPLGIFENADGDVLICDGQNGIRKFDHVTETLTTLFSGGFLILPTSIVQLPNGDYLVSDAGLFGGQTSKILRITQSGTQSIVSQGGLLTIPIDFELITPDTILVNNAGSIAGGVDGIIKIDLNIGAQNLISSGGQLSFPSGSAFVSAASNFYAINQNSKMLLHINRTNGLQTQLALHTPLAGPFGISSVSEIPNPVQPPTEPASNIVFSNILSDRATITFTPGNGTHRVVLMRRNVLGLTCATPNEGFFFAGNSDFSMSQNFCLNGVQYKMVYADTGNVVTVTGLISGWEYNVKVLEFNRDGDVDYPLFEGAPSGFVTPIAQPLVYVTTPADGAINQKTKLNLTAKAVTGATTYTIEISPNGDFSSGVISKSGIKTQTFDSLHYGTMYFTRVKTNLRPDFGKITSFTTIAAEQLAYVITPKDLAINQKVSLSVTSNIVPLATEYTIQLDTTSDFTAPIVHTGGRTQTFTGLRYNTIYYSRVRTEFTENWGAIKSFKTLNPATISYVITPANGAVNQKVSLSVTANLVPNATEYTIELNTDVNFGDSTSIVQTGGRTQMFSGLQYNTTYYTRVRTEFTQDWGATRSFTTINAVDLSYVYTPANNAINVNTSLNITANTVPGAAEYTIELSESSSFDTVAFTRTGPTRTLAFSGLKYNTKYYNWVATDQGEGFGQIRSFTTRTAESISYVTAPANNAINVNTTLNVSANTVPGATSYTIQLSVDSAFSVIAFERTGPTRTLAFSGLQLGTTYYNRVTTNAPGAIGFGQVRKFKTKGIPPAPPAAPPAEGAAPPAARLASDIVSVDKPELAEITELDVEIYPNPFREKLVFTIKSPVQGQAKVSLTDINGRQIHESIEQTNTKVEIEKPLATGVYLLRVMADKEQKIIRVVKTD